MNEFDNLRRAWADLKTEMKETQPFKAVYTALIWVLDRLTDILERRK